MLGTGIEEKEPALPRLNSNSMAGLEVYILKEWPHSEISIGLCMGYNVQIF